MSFERKQQLMHIRFNVGSKQAYIQNRYSVVVDGVEQYEITRSTPVERGDDISDQEQLAQDMINHFWSLTDE